MVHASPQLTPAQLIDAGRRAEAQGRPDLAVQFYSHLAEHFGDAVQAAEAHGALGRIGPWKADGRSGPQAPAHRGGRLQPPAARSRYAAGRALTRFFSLLGWLVALAGPAAVPACLTLRVDAACTMHAGMLPMTGGAAVSLIVGLSVVLGAHVARARFDEVNAVRDLLALERAKLGLE